MLNGPPSSKWIDYCSKCLSVHKVCLRLAVLNFSTSDMWHICRRSRWILKEFLINTLWQCMRKTKMRTLKNQNFSDKGSQVRSSVEFSKALGLKHKAFTFSLQVPMREAISKRQLGKDYALRKGSETFSETRSRCSKCKLKRCLHYNCQPGLTLTLVEPRLSTLFVYTPFRKS